MAVEQTFIFGWAGENSANPITNQVAVSADGEDNRSISLPAGQSVTVDLDWVAARLKGFYAQSPRSFKLILNPNGSNPEEFTPDAGTPIEWVAASGMYYPFEEATVTQVRLVSLDDENDQTVTIKTIQDATP